MTTNPLSDKLAGRAVLLPVDRRAADLATALERHGARVDIAPPLSNIPHVEDEQLVSDTRALLGNPPDVVVGTTGIGFRGWMEAADAAGIGNELRELIGSARLLARGPKAKAAAHRAGLKVEWVAASETSGELTDKLIADGIDGLTVAIQHHGFGDPRMEQRLIDAGATVHGLTSYRCGPPKDPELVTRSAVAAADGMYDAVLFTSAPGADAWFSAAKDAGVMPSVTAAAESGRTIFLSVGPVTAQPLEILGIPTEWPERYRMGALAKLAVARLSGAGPSGS